LVRKHKKFASSWVTDCIYICETETEIDLVNKETEQIVNLYKGLPLAERLQRIDHIQARRFSKLTGTASEIATEGIIRHLAACDRMDVNPDISAVREIIDDALNGRRVYAEAAEITRAA